MQYVNNKDMGFDKDKLVVIDINSGKIRRSAATIKDEFAKIAQVKSVSVTLDGSGRLENYSYSKSEYRQQ